MTILSERIARPTAAPSRALQYLPATAFGVDAVLMAVSCLVAVLGRKYLDIFEAPGDLSANVGVMVPFVIVGWLATTSAFGSYAADVFGAGTDEYKRILNASVFAAGVVGVTCYLFSYQLSRGFFLLTFAVGSALLILGRLAIRRAVQSARLRGGLLQRVVIVGGPGHVDEIAAVLRRERHLGYQVTGAFVPAGSPGHHTPSGIPVLGDASDPAAVSAADDLDVLFFTGGSSRNARDLRRILWELEQRSVQLVMAPSITDMASDRVKIRPVGGLPLVHLEAPRWAQASRWAKRTFDLVGSSLLIVLFSPLILLAALRVKLHDGGAVFFRQIRVGKDGEHFACLKFRTMVMNAEAMVAELQQEQGVDALLFKLKDDPRITRPGKWLRRYSVDELPQLFNVFLGHMSLVGPRPQVPREVELYDDAMSRRLRVRPGMTGLWQVSGRNDLSVEDSIRLDLYYVDNWSMLQDLNILMKTIGAVFASRGAY